MIRHGLRSLGEIARFGLCGLIRIYQLCLSPVLGPNCRFVPTCSDYALAAIAVHGAVQGSLLATTRILRCNPWHPGGYDPVPPGRCGCSHSSS